MLKSPRYYRMCLGYTLSLLGVCTTCGHFNGNLVMHNIWENQICNLRGPNLDLINLNVCIWVYCVCITDFFGWSFLSESWKKKRKSEVFFGVSNCQTLKKTFNNCHTLYKVSIVSQRYRRMVRTFLFSYFFKPNLMKSSCRWLSLWLLHKIEGQNWGGKEGGNNT